MPRLSRVVLPDHVHHVTQRGVRRGDIFWEDADRWVYLRHMKEQTARFGVQVLSYCLMTNHVHLLAVPSTPDGLARAIGEAHRRYTLFINRKVKVSGYLFQGRFASCPLDEAHLLAAARYVLLNPVRAHLVERAINYCWSSAAFHTQDRTRDGLVEKNDLLGLLPDTRAWRQLLENEADVEKDEQAGAVRQLTRTGRPCGTPTFVDHAEQICGRPLAPKKPGPVPRFPKI